MAQLAPVWKRRLAGGAILLTSSMFVFLLIYRPAWTGFGPDATRTTERDSTGKVIKIVEVEQSGKNLWNWLSVLGVPLSLAALGFWFQQQQQRRADEQAKFEKERAEQQAKFEKEIAENNQQEEILQAYFDRLSALLVDKNLLAIATKFGASSSTEIIASAEDKELLDSSVDVIRARTLSILRRLKGSRKRKSSVIQFLVEAGIVSKLKLSLRDADLSNVHLMSVNFDNTDLEGADLSGASLVSASLFNANLRDADLACADLSFAKLNGASLFNANLRNANLTCADLSNADLLVAHLGNADLHSTKLRKVARWTEKQLSEAKLSNTQLPDGCVLNPNRDCQEMQKSKQK